MTSHGHVRIGILGAAKIAPSALVNPAKRNLLRRRSYDPFSDPGLRATGSRLPHVGLNDAGEPVLPTQNDARRRS
jgi:hypothetical protein